MANEYKTLLKIEGDATGAVRATEQAKAAAESLRQTTQDLTTQQLEAGTAAQNAVPAPVRQPATEELAGEKEKITEITRAGTNAITRMMGLFSPLAARLTAMGEAVVRTFSDIYRSGMALPAAVAIGFTAAIAAVSAYWDQVVAAAREAAEEQEAIRKGAAERRGDIGKELARIGIGPERIGRASARAAMLEKDQGIGKEAAARAAAIAEEQNLSDEEMLRVAAGIELGQFRGEKTTRRGRTSEMEAFRRRLTRPDESARNRAKILNRAQAVAEQRDREAFEERKRWEAESSRRSAEDRMTAGDWLQQGPVVGGIRWGTRQVLEYFAPVGQPRTAEIERARQSTEDRARRAAPALPAPPGPQASVTINNYGHMYNRDLELGPVPQMGMA